MEEVHEGTGADEEQVGEDEEAGVGLREVDCCAVEIGALVEGFEQAGGSGCGGGAGVESEADHGNDSCVVVLVVGGCSVFHCGRTVSQEVCRVEACSLRLSRVRGQLAGASSYGRSRGSSEG